MKPRVCLQGATALGLLLGVVPLQAQAVGSEPEGTLRRGARVSLVSVGNASAEQCGRGAGLSGGVLISGGGSSFLQGAADVLVTSFVVCTDLLPVRQYEGVNPLKCGGRPNSCSHLAWR